MGKQLITALLDESDIAELETIAERNRVLMARVIRTTISNYLAGINPGHLISPAT